MWLSHSFSTWHICQPALMLSCQGCWHTRLPGARDAPSVSCPSSSAWEKASEKYEEKKGGRHSKEWASTQITVLCSTCILVFSLNPANTMKINERLIIFTALWQWLQLSCVLHIHWCRTVELDAQQECTTHSTLLRSELRATITVLQHPRLKKKRTF